MRDEYGEEVFYNTRQAKNLLDDLCPHMPRERIQVKNFIEMNGYPALKYAGEAYPVVRSKLIDTYKGIYNVNDEIAEWVLDVFSVFLGYIGEEGSGISASSSVLSIVSGYKDQAEEYGAKVVKTPGKEDAPAEPADPPPRIVPKPAAAAKAAQRKPTPINVKHRHIAADYHTVAIKEDGTVAATGYNNFGQCNVWHWFDIISVAAGSGFTVGLRKNGTVVAAGRNDFDQCNVGKWQDVIAISAGARHTVGLLPDGTVIAAGQNKYGECLVSDWRNVTAVFAGNQCTYAIKRDKKILARGYNKNIDYDISRLSNIIRIADANPHGALALKADGTVVKARKSMKGDFSKIRNVSELVSTPDCFIGLRKDGTVRVLAYYWESSGVECSPDEWSEICEIAAGRYHVVGLRKDGTLVAAMLHTNRSLDRGQCGVEGWEGIRV